MTRSHLEEIHEGYFKHMFTSLKYAFKFLLAAVYCIIHAFLPDIFKCRASNIARDIAYDAEQRSQK